MWGYFSVSGEAGGCFQWKRRKKSSSRRRWSVSFSWVAAHLKVGGRCKLQDLRDHLDKAVFTPEISAWRLFDILLKKKKWKLLIYLKSCSLPEPVLFRWFKVKILEDRLTDWALLPWLIEYFIWIRSTKNQYDSRERKKIHVYVCECVCVFLWAQTSPSRVSMVLMRTVFLEWTSDERCCCDSGLVSVKDMVTPLHKGIQ